MWRNISKKYLDYLSIIGIFISAYLLYIHFFSYNDPTALSGLCALSNLINCETTSQSQWSIFLGMPIAFWGIVSFSALLLLREYDRQIIAAALCVAMMLKSGQLLYLAAVKLHSLCPFCLAINLVTLIVIWGQMRLCLETVKINKCGFVRMLKTELFTTIPCQKLLLPFIAVIATVTTMYPRYWEMPDINFLNTVCGVTEDEHPYIESKAPPEIIIEEYSDYSCESCLNGQRLIRNLISKGARARLIHRNFPLSSNCNPLIPESNFHKFSCTYALWSIGMLKEKGVEAFWKTNDLIFKKRDFIGIAEISETIGQDINAVEKVAETQAAAMHLAGDILSGIRREISGTPSYFVRGKKVSIDELTIALKKSAKNGI